MSDDAPNSLLDGLPRDLPALRRAEKLQKRAARVGFDWPALPGVLDKVREEVEEVRAEVLKADHDRWKVQEELGDLLFACVNLARHLEVDAETALQGAAAKFERRFRAVESAIQERGISLKQASLTEMDELWEKIKGREQERAKP